MAAKLVVLMVVAILATRGIESKPVESFLEVVEVSSEIGSTAKALEVGSTSETSKVGSTDADSEAGSTSEISKVGSTETDSEIRSTEVDSEVGSTVNALGTTSESAIEKRDLENAERLEVAEKVEEGDDDLETAAGTNILRPLFVYRQQVAYRERIRKAGRRAVTNPV